MPTGYPMVHPPMPHIKYKGNMYKGYKAKVFFF